MCSINDHLSTFLHFYLSKTSHTPTIQSAHGIVQRFNELHNIQSESNTTDNYHNRFTQRPKGMAYNEVYTPVTSHIQTCILYMKRQVSA